MRRHNRRMRHPIRLLIWDHTGAPPEARDTEQTIVFWRSYRTHGFANAVSIPQWVEDHADTLRRRYLAWVYEMGETRIRGERVTDHLALRPGFSAWWMSLLVEKCNFAKSPQIEDAIRLIAFVDWVGERILDRMTLVSAKKALADSMKHWCNARQVGFEYQRTLNPNTSTSFLRIVYTCLPHPIRASIWLIQHIRSRRALRGAGLRDWQGCTGDIVFISYLLNLVPDAATDGIFESHYWGHLPETLRKQSTKTHWLHLYLPHDVLPTAKRAAEQINRFNRKAGRVQSHVTLDSFLSITVVGKALRDWLRLLRTGMGLQMQRYMPKLGELNLWPLFRHDWKDSVIGAAALRNMLMLNLFEAAFKIAPDQKLGIYLQENMDWEYAALYAWKANQPGRIIGCPHTSVRYWDLRYFFDPRVYHANQQHPMPRPDQVAVNGPTARAAYRQGGYPENELVDVEALRFLHLNRAESALNLHPQPNIRLLVLGEYSKITTMALMQLLQDSAAYLPNTLSIIVKPHPACPIDPQAYPRLHMTLNTQPLPELARQGDRVLTGAVTTAALDAYCLGLPVITFLDPKILNMSPLRGHAGVTFVETPEGLVHAIRDIPAQTKPEKKPSDQFFYLDRGLSRWKKLLGLSQDSGATHA